MWFAADPAAEMAEVRRWRRSTLEAAEQFDALMPLVYQANLRSSPIGDDVGALSALEDVLRDDKPMFEDWQPYSSNAWGARDWVITALERHEAAELLAVLERGNWTTAVDAAAALVHVPALLERVKAVLATVLKIRVGDA